MPAFNYRIIVLLFFASGAIALMYEVVWARMMSHVFGSTALAVGTVLAAWMAGMALGAWKIGKRADRHPNALRLYGWLEIGIAAMALVSHVLIHQLGTAHQLIYQWTGSSAFLFSLTRFVLAFVLIMAPTVLMGATLPVLVRFFSGRQVLVGVNISTLYALNTLGAVCGVLLTGFYLIGAYGIHVPVYLAVAGNIAVGLASLALARRFSFSGETPSGPAPEVGSLTEDQVTLLGAGTYRVILLGLGLSGFTSFAYEIYWTRSLVFIMGNSTYALTTMLAAFLTGIALGGYGIRYILNRDFDRSVVFGWIQVLIGIFSALALPVLFSASDPQSLNQFLLKTHDDAIVLTLSGFGVAFMVMLTPAMLIGATFPLVGQIAAKDPDRTAATVGQVYAVNTVGNVLGALLPGLILINWLGIQKGIVAMAVLNIGLGFLVLSLRLLGPPPRPAWRVALPLALLLTVTLLSRAPLAFQFPSAGEQPWYETLFYREGPLATTKVYRNPRNGEKHISVDGIVIGGTGQSEFKQLLLAHLPKLLLDDVSSELSVGVGSGILLGESMKHASVESVTGVEIEPSVIEGATWFAEENYKALENPRLRIVVDDVGSFLRTSTDHFQVISADEKTADEYASNGFSYSLDYYKLLRDHLAEGGLAAQWVPTTLPPRQYRMILRTFAKAFPYVQLWYFLPANKRGPFNTILVGSSQAIKVQIGTMRNRFQARAAAMESLEPYGLTSADVFIPHFVASRDTLLEQLQDAPLNSLEFPRYEFFYPWEYAIQRQTKFFENHAFIIELKMKELPKLLAGLEADTEDLFWIRKSLAAEFRYLTGFRRFLEGIPLEENYRIFDAALALAPWNDSLRARIYLQYSYLASTRRNAAERARLMHRANALYPDKQ